MLANFVQETANAPGTTASINLGGAVAGRRPFIPTFASGSTVFYGMDDGTLAEMGIGVVTAGSPNTLNRTTVLWNSAGTTARMNFLGTVRVYCALPAERHVYTDGTGTLQGVSAAAVRTAAGATAVGAGVLTAVDAAAARAVINALSQTMNTSRLLGRTSAGSGNVEEITVGAGLTFSGTTLSLSNTTGTLLNVQVFTSSGTYTRSAGVTRALVVAVGGGGGGGTPTGVSNGNAGSGGGTTSFGSHVSAAGGGGGTGALTGIASPANLPGDGGTGGTGALLSIKGTPGYAGQGGGSGGGRQPSVNGNGTAGVRGGGGSGARNAFDIGCGQQSINQSGGGGQGETAIDYITAGLGATETVTVGAGGAGATGGAFVGGAGGAGYVIVYEYS